MGVLTFLQIKTTEQHAPNRGHKHFPSVFLLLLLTPPFLSSLNQNHPADSEIEQEDREHAQGFPIVRHELRHESHRCYSRPNTTCDSGREQEMGKNRKRESQLGRD